MSRRENVESAESKKETLKAMYNWYSRMANQYYKKIQKLSDNFCAINGDENLHYEEPTSLHILDEMESFELLDGVIKSEAPIFLKTNQIDQYLSKYISQSNPLHRIIGILKKYDEYAFYSNKEIQDYSDRGIIDDKDIRKHIKSFALLQKFIAKDPTFIQRSDEDIMNILDNEIGI